MKLLPISFLLLGAFLFGSSESRAAGGTDVWLYLMPGIRTVNIPQSVINFKAEDNSPNYDSMSSVINLKKTCRAYDGLLGIIVKDADGGLFGKFQFGGYGRQKVSGFDIDGGLGWDFKYKKSFHFMPGIDAAYTFGYMGLGSMIRTDNYQEINGQQFTGKQLDVSAYSGYFSLKPTLVLAWDITPYFGLIGDVGYQFSFKSHERIEYSGYGSDGKSYSEYRKYSDPENIAWTGENSVISGMPFSYSGWFVHFGVKFEVGDFLSRNPNTTDCHTCGSGRYSRPSGNINNPQGYNMTPGPEILKPRTPLNPSGPSKPKVGY